jgi:outer membrane receptor protein involved in Fe transport
LTSIPVLRYGSGHRKRWFKNPVQITNYANIVPSHYTVDLAVSYDMGDQPENEYLRNISLQRVVNNVTNKRPPFAYKASTSGSGGSAFWGFVDSPIQRQISLTITKTW